jgi:hypothetical protein
MRVLNKLPILAAITLALISQTTIGTRVPVNQLGTIPANPPKQTVTTVASATPNSFPLPAGTSVCIVTRNIAQSPGIDYAITGAAVIFTAAPAIGDVVQLNCW